MTSAIGRAPRASACSQLLEHEHRAPLGDDEAVAGGVERARGDGRRCTRRCRGRRGEPSARIWPKPAKASGTSAASVPGAEHDVGLAAHDRLHRLADGVAAGRAGADDGHVRSADAVLDGDHAPTARRGACAAAGTGETRPGPRSRRVLRPVEHHADAADRGAEHHPEAVRIGLAGVDCPSSPSRPASRSASPVAATARCVLRSWRRTSLRVHVVGRVEALHLAGDVDRRSGVVSKSVMSVDSRAARRPGCPRSPRHRCRPARRRPGR